MQVLAAVAPVVAEYLPAPQLMQVLAVVAPTVGEYVPAPQLVHTLDVVAPTVGEYPPAKQFVHAALPEFVLYLPAKHAVHVPPLGPVYPRLQRQEPIAVCAVAVVTEFAGQAVHAALPLAPLYVLKTHAEHVPPSGPVYPRLHLHAEMAVFPSVSVTELIQYVHASAPVEPLYVFTGQEEQEPEGPVEPGPQGGGAT